MITITVRKNRKLSAVINYYSPVLLPDVVATQYFAYA